MRQNTALAIGLNPISRTALDTLTHTCDVIEAEDAEQALPLLQSRIFHIIFLDSQSTAVTPRIFDLLRSVAPDIPKVVLGAQTHADVFEHLADDPHFQLLSFDLPPEEFESKAQQIMQPRGGTRLRVATAAFRAIANLGDYRFEHPVVDLSNSGISLSVPLDAPVASYVAGAEIQSLRIVDGDGTEVFTTPLAHIRNSKLDSSFDRASLRVGLSFDQPPPRGPQHEKIVTEPARILATFRKLALAELPLAVGRLDSDETFRVMVRRVETRQAGGGGPRVVLGPRPERLERHEVVRIAFEYHGLSYSGLVPVLDTADDLHLAPPRTLRVHHRRSSNRHRPSPERPYSVRLVSGLAGLDATLPVYDLNASGLSAEVDLKAAVLPPGLVLERLELHLPDRTEPIVCRGIVRALRRLPLNPGTPKNAAQPALCGIELLDLHADDRRRLSASLVFEGFPHLEVAGEGEFDLIWKMLADARFTFHLYADGSDESRRAAEKSFGRTLGPARHIGIPLVFRTDEGLRGHITGLRIYDRTWLATHLAAMQSTPAAPTARISRALCMGLIEHLENQPTAEYVKFMWKKDQRWANRMFGWSGRAIHRPGYSEMRDFGVLVRPTTMPLAIEADPAVDIRSSTDSDLHQVEMELLRQVSLVRLRSEDLHGSGLMLHKLGRVYESCGLSRSRHVRVAYSDGRLVGFSLIEETTPALQLTEVLNSFEAFLCGGTEPELRPRVLRALLRDAILRSIEFGQSCTVALPDPSMYPAYQEAGFTEAGLARSWTWHRSLLRSWADVWDQLYVRGREYFKSGE